MNKIILILSLLLFFNSQGSDIEHESKIELRPLSVQKIVDECFDHISSSSIGQWRNIGQRDYDMDPFTEYEIIKFHMKKSIGHDSKEYNILDVGSGYCNFGKTIMKLINENEYFKDKGISVKIYSLLGEKYPDTKYMDEGICTHFILDQFKIENISDSFAQLKIDCQFDFIISSMCFRHLRDPIGTRQQVFNHLLKIKGLFLYDGYKGDEYNYLDLLIFNKNPFLMYVTGNPRELAIVLVEKLHNEDIRPILRYSDETSITNFNYCEPENTIYKGIFSYTEYLDHSLFLSTSKVILFGHKSLYCLIEENNLFYSNEQAKFLSQEEILEQDYPKKIPSFIKVENPHDIRLAENILKRINEDLDPLVKKFHENCKSKNFSSSEEFFYLEGWNK